MIPKLLSIQDYCSYGRCALIVTIPVLSAAGVQPIGLPTSYFSNHPFYPNMHFSDMSDKAMDALHMWEKNEITFDCIQTGFISDLREMDVIMEAIRLFHKPGQLLIVDPAMGDNGSLYQIFDQRIVEAMKELSTHATCVTPNYTEALFMTGREYKETSTLEEMQQIAKELAALGPKYVVITSAPTEETKICTFYYNSETEEFNRVETERIPLYSPGTGDIFTAVLSSSLLAKESLDVAVQKAVDFTFYCVKKTLEKGTNPIEGVVLEECLPYLWGEK